MEFWTFSVREERFIIKVSLCLFIYLFISLFIFYFLFFLIKLIVMSQMQPKVLSDNNITVDQNVWRASLNKIFNEYSITFWNGGE